MKVNNFAFNYVIGVMAVVLLVSMLFFPAQALHASLKGLSIWWDILFPALLPFLVISEMMLGLGIVHFFGMLLDPIMRPVFRIPGIGGFVMAMGFAAGYPVAARLTSQLWEQRLISREEGERLVAFTTTSDPIFLIGAVSVGFFHDASLAGILAAAHYGTAVIVGLIMRFHGGAASKQITEAAPPATGITSSRRLLTRAFKAMHRARLLDGRSLGEMLTQAVQSSLQMVMVIGGLVVFFAVVIEIMTSMQVMPIVYKGINAVLQLFGVPTALSEAVAGGLFEVTLGAKAAGSAPASISLMHKAAIAAFILSWAGLSVHAQIVSILHHTNLRYFPFITARLVHGLLAATAVILLWEPMQSFRGATALSMPVISLTAALPTKPNSVLTWIAGACIGVLLGLLMFYALHLAVKQCMKWLK
ncbi:sporulation integral membrane protein YlbJ [Paenibacillus periandrae]|uniref:sporulation integral membrane protein YlbJ n=1 Tax=Paenibacillus periandrae TaxID=1761741 RepID=UPI001F08D2C3|nr:sporulation integral membrane protein YlbJ [Paenibacillus periandrae]